MREILFRGKRIDNGEWIKGFYCQVANESDGGTRIKQTILVPTFLCQSGFKLWEVDSETVGQYTGLTDKIGKKIFEGDIVRTHYANVPKAVFVETVIFDGGKFCATSTNEGCKTIAALWDGVPRLAIDKSVYMDEVEVIGNIYDKPELLEVEK